MPIAPGETFERYEVEALIGQGGMGSVYRATDTKLRRKVALKVLRSGRDGPEAVARMFREARAAAALSHPNTVAIHDLGETDGTVYLVMEYISGKPLLAYVGDARVTVATKVRWLVGIARALAAAHKAGLVHRDVKPTNVMITDEEAVKVLDFGLAKPRASGPVSFKTLAGHQVGTPRYMAPEQLEGADADARSDQYAFGVTAYELLGGTHPGPPGEAPATPLEALEPKIPAPIAHAITRALAADPNARWSNMEELADALENTMRSSAAVPTAPATTIPEGDRKTMPSDAPAPGGAATPMAGGAPNRPHDVARTMMSRQAPPGIVTKEKEPDIVEVRRGHTMPLRNVPAIVPPGAPASPASPASPTSPASPASPPRQVSASVAPPTAAPVNRIVLGIGLGLAVGAAVFGAWLALVRTSPAPASVAPPTTTKTVAVPIAPEEPSDPAPSAVAALPTRAVAPSRPPAPSASAAPTPSSPPAPPTMPTAPTKKATDISLGF